MFIESTAEGIGGLFHDQVKKAQAFRKTGRQLSEMDYKLHFYPWHRSADYRSDADIEAYVERNQVFRRVGEKSTESS